MISGNIHNLGDSRPDDSIGLAVISLELLEAGTIYGILYSPFSPQKPPLELDSESRFFLTCKHLLVKFDIDRIS